MLEQLKAQAVQVSVRCSLEGIMCCDFNACAA
jgi:hypothetical protein